MKTPILLFSFIMALITLDSSAQYQINDASKRDVRQHKNLYVEFGGSSLGTTLNFDMRLDKGSKAGLGFRVGIGQTKSNVALEDGTKFLATTNTFPMGLSFLSGTKKSFLDAEIGLIPAISNAQGMHVNKGFATSDGFFVAASYAKLGFRHLPKSNGITYGIHWSPMIKNGTGMDFKRFGISVGYSFF